jgi:hypothetical protein
MEKHEFTGYVPMRVKILERMEDADNELVVLPDGKKTLRHRVDKFQVGEVVELDPPRAQKLIGFGYAEETEEPVTRVLV